MLKSRPITALREITIQILPYLGMKKSHNPFKWFNIASIFRYLLNLTISLQMVILQQTNEKDYTDVNIFTCF